MSAIAQLMKPVGPIAEAFAWDKRLITFIMGPVGSAKTTTCIRKMIHGALWQKPGPDGVYRAKWGVIRDTYPQLRKTALASWFQWFPKALGEWNGEAPYEHTVRFDIHTNRGKLEVELTVIFAAIGENKAEDVMRGWEVTGIWINEGDLVSHEVFAYAVTRVGRFPSASQGGCQWRGLIVDMNAPDIENWTYTVGVDQDLGITDEVAAELLEELGELMGIGFHRQPGGRSKDPLPENIQNLPKGYYAQQIFALAKKPWLIRRMVDNEFGPVRNGQPVFTEYNDDIHCAKDKLAPIPGVKLKISADAGGTPAAVIRQRNPANGQIRFLAEVVMFAEEADDELEQMGATAFGKLVGRYVREEFPNCDVYEIVRVDPASAAGESATGADPSWRQNFQKGLRSELGERIRVKKSQCRSNRLDERLQAVRDPMLRLCEGGVPGFVICPVRCKTLRRGFKGMYVITRTGVGISSRFKDEPVKNHFSHVQDAVQYGCVDEKRGANDNDDDDGGGTRHPGSAERSSRREVKVERDYNVHSRRGR
jgi:hypothetical protein